MEVAAPDFAALWKPMDSGLRRLLRDMRGGSVHEGTLTREQWMQMYTDDVYNICVTSGSRSKTIRRMGRRSTSSTWYGADPAAPRLLLLPLPLRANTRRPQLVLIC